jgi:hypothetical protein
MTYQVKKPVSKFAFQMRPAALHLGEAGGGGREQRGAVQVEFSRDPWLEKRLASTLEPIK